MRYLVATDGSAVSDTAVEHAAIQASIRGAVLDIVHVLTPETELIEGDIVLAGDEAAMERGEQVVGSVAKSVVDRATVPVTIVK